VAITLPADPYIWPYDVELVPGRTALLMVYWQHDFCGPGGYVDKMGYDISLTRRGLEPARRVLDACRSISAFAIVHTREGHKPDLPPALPTSSGGPGRWAPVSEIPVQVAGY